MYCSANGAYIFNGGVSSACFVTFLVKFFLYGASLWSFDDELYYFAECFGVPICFFALHEKDSELFLFEEYFLYS